MGLKNHLRSFRFGCRSIGNTEERAYRKELMKIVVYFWLSHLKPTIKLNANGTAS